MENDIRCWMQNHLDVALRRINQNHIPHIVSAGKKMVVWSDVRETLFFWCMSPRCTVMLDVLKHHMRYPMSDSSMHVCTQLEQSLFMKQFVVVSVGTLLVDLNDIRQRSSLMVLYDMVKLKHRQSRDPRVRDCNTMMMAIKDDYSKTAFKNPVAGSSSKNLVPAARRVGKKTPRCGTEHGQQSSDMMVQGQGAKNPKSGAVEQGNDQEENGTSIVEITGDIVRSSHGEGKGGVETTGDIIGSSRGEGRDVAKVAGDVSGDGEGRRSERNETEVDGKGRGGHAGEETGGETEAASTDQAEETASEEPEQSCAIITDSVAPDRTPRDRVGPDEVLVPLTLLREMVSGDAKFLEMVVRLYMQGQCGDGLRSVTQCRVEEALHMTRFLACYRGYVWPWKCLTSCSMMMSWHEFCMGCTRFKPPVVLVRGLDVSLAVSSCAVLTEVPERPKAKTTVKKEKSNGEIVCTTSLKTSSDFNKTKCTGSSRAQSTAGFAAIKTGQNHYTLHWNKSDASSNAVECRDKSSANKVPRNHSGLGSKCMKNKKNKVAVSKSDSSLSEMKKHPPSKCQPFYKQKVHQVTGQKNTARDVYLQKNGKHTTSNVGLTAKGKVRDVNEQKNKLGNTNKVSNAKEHTDAVSISSRLDRFGKNAVCKDDEILCKWKIENADNDSLAAAMLPKSSIRIGTSSDNRLAANAEITSKDGVVTVPTSVVETVHTGKDKDIRIIERDAGNNRALTETEKQCIDTLESVTKGNCSLKDGNVSPVRQWTVVNQGASGEDVIRSVSGLNNITNTSSNSYKESALKRAHLKMSSPQLLDAFPGCSKLKSEAPIKSLLHNPTIQTATSNKYRMKQTGAQCRSATERKFVYNVLKRRWESVEMDGDRGKCPQLGLCAVQQSDVHTSKTGKPRCSLSADTSASYKGSDSQNKFTLDDFRAASVEGNCSSSAKTERAPPSKAVTVTTLHLTKSADCTLTDKNGVNSAVRIVHSGGRRVITTGNNNPMMPRHAESAMLSTSVDASVKEDRLGAFKSDSCIPGGTVNGQSTSKTPRVVNPVDIPRAIDCSKPFIAIRSTTIPTPKPTKVNAPVPTPRAEKQNSFIVSLKGVTKGMTNYGSSSSDQPDIYDKFARKTKVLKPVISPSRKSSQSPRKSCTQDTTQNSIETAFCSSTSVKKAYNVSHQNDNSSLGNKGQVSNLNRLQCKHSANVQGREATWKRITTSQQPSTSSHWSPAVSRVLASAESTSCSPSRYDQPAYSDLSVANDSPTSHNVFKELLQKVRDGQSQGAATSGVHPDQIKSDSSLRPSASLESIDSLKAIAVMKPIPVPGVSKQVGLHGSKNNPSCVETSKAGNKNLNCKVIYNCPDCFKRRSLSCAESRRCDSGHQSSTGGNKDKQFLKVDSKLYFSNGRSFHELQADSFVPSGAQFYIQTDTGDIPPTTRPHDVLCDNLKNVAIPVSQDKLDDLLEARKEADQLMESESDTQIMKGKGNIESKHNLPDDVNADRSLTRCDISHAEVNLQSEQCGSSNRDQSAYGKPSQCSKSTINKLAKKLSSENEFPARSSSTILAKAEVGVASPRNKHEDTASCKTKGKRPGRKIKTKSDTVCIEDAGRKQTLRNRGTRTSSQNSKNSARQERYQLRNNTKSRERMHSAGTGEDRAASSDEEIDLKSEMSSGRKRGRKGKKLGRGRPRKGTEKKILLRSKHRGQKAVVAGSAIEEQQTVVAERSAIEELHNTESCSESLSIGQNEPKPTVGQVNKGAVDNNCVSSSVLYDCSPGNFKERNSIDDCKENTNVIIVEAETGTGENVDPDLEDLWPEQVVEEGSYTEVETFYDNTDGGIDVHQEESVSDIFYDSCNEDGHAPTPGYSYEGLDTNYVVVYDDLVGLPDMSHECRYIQDGIEVQTTPLEDNGMVSMKDCYSENCNWLVTNHQDFSTMDTNVSDIHPEYNECKCDSIEEKASENISKEVVDIESEHRLCKCEIGGSVQDQNDEEKTAGLRAGSNCPLMEFGSCDVKNCTLGWPANGALESNGADTEPLKIHEQVNVSGTTAACMKTPAISSVSNDTLAAYNRTFDRSEKLSHSPEHLCEKRNELKESHSENDVAVSKRYTQSCFSHLVLEENKQDKSDRFTHGDNIFDVLREELDKTRCRANDRNRASKVLPVHEHISEGTTSGQYYKTSNREFCLMKPHQSNTQTSSCTNNKTNMLTFESNTLRAVKDVLATKKVCPLEEKRTASANAETDSYFTSLNPRSVHAETEINGDCINSIKGSGATTHLRKSTSFSGDIDNMFSKVAGSSVSKTNINKQFPHFKRPESDRKSAFSYGEETHIEISKRSNDAIIINDDVIVIDDDDHDCDSHVQLTQAANDDSDDVTEARNSTIDRRNNKNEQNTESETEMKSFNMEESNAKLSKAWKLLSKKIKSRNKNEIPSTRITKACVSKQVNPTSPCASTSSQSKTVIQETVKETNGRKDRVTSKKLKKSNTVRKCFSGGDLPSRKLARETNAEISCMKKKSVVCKEVKKSSVISKKHDKKIAILPKAEPKDNQKAANEGLEKNNSNSSLATSDQNMEDPVENRTKTDDETIDSATAVRLLNSDKTMQMAATQKHQKKRKSSKLRTGKGIKEDEDDVDNKEIQAKRAAENFIRKQQIYLDIIANSSTEASPHCKSMCPETRDPGVAGTDVPSGVPVLGDRVISKALADAERALEGTGSLEDSDDETVVLKDIVANCKYQLVSDEDGINLGGVAYLLEHELPFVYVNGYKFCALRDVLTLFQPRCCPTRCLLPRKILQNHHGLVKSYSTWEQVYKFGLIKMSKGPAVVTGDLLVKLDSLVSLLPELSADIVAAHVNTKYKWSQNCNVRGYTSFQKS